MKNNYSFNISQEDVLRISKNILYICLIIAFTFNIIINIKWAFKDTGYNDFGSFYSSAKAFIDGENPYSSDYEYIFSPELNGRNVPSPNLNPPISLFFISVFTLFDIQTSFQLWKLFSLILYVISIILIITNIPFPCEKRVLKIFWALAMAGFWQTIQFGQIYIPLFFLLVCAYVFIASDHLSIAGILLGVICAIKPNFLILLIVILITGNKKIFLSALATFLGLSVLPLFFRNIELYKEWYEASKNYPGILFSSNNSFIGLFSRLELVSVGFFISIMVALFVFFVIIVKPTSIYQSLYLGILLSLLCSPITWAGYIILIIPHVMTRAKWELWQIFPFFILTIPIIFIYGFASPFKTINIFWGWWYGISLLYLLILEIVTYKKLPSRTFSLL